MHNAQQVCHMLLRHKTSHGDVGRYWMTHYPGALERHLQGSPIKGYADGVDALVYGARKSMQFVCMRALPVS